MPIEFDDQSLRIIGHDVKAILFYDSARVLQQEIYLQSDNTLNIGDTEAADGISSVLTTHALDGSAHVGVLASSQGPQFLLKDGTRNLTGNLGVDASITIDGVDISAHDHSGGGQGGTIDHDSLGGLADDDHSQYVHISTNRTITAQHAFSPASAQAPFTLGANAQSQLVIGLRADQLNKSITAGNGLTGGGTLTESRTVTLGTPTTLTASTSNSVTATSHTHTISVGTPGNDSVNLAASQPGDATALVRSNHTHQLDESITPTWTGAHLFSGTTELRFRDATTRIYSDQSNHMRLKVAELATVLLSDSGGGYIYLGSSDDVEIYAGGVFKVNANSTQFANWNAGDSIESDNYVSQSTGWAISYGSSGGHADFRSMYADELHVKAFIADIYSAMAGAIILTKSRAKLSRDFTIPNTSVGATIYLEDLEGWDNTQVFAANDYIRLRVIDRSGGGLVVADVYGQVTSYSDLSGGEQSWTFTTTTTGYSSADTIYAGSVALDYGQTGSGSRGVWEVTVLDAAGAPYSQVQTWSSISSGEPSNFTTHVRLGNLDGISGIGLEYGLFAGEGVSAGDKYFRATDQNFDMHNIALAMYDSTNTQRISMDPNVGPTAKMAWFGPSSTDPRFIVYGDGDVWLSSLAVGDLGDLLFSQSDGLLLLGPYGEMMTTSWTSTRGAVATLSGAFHQEAGRWPLTRGLVVEEETTNLCTNPSFETNTTGWATSGTNTIAQSSNQAQTGDYSLKCTYQDNVRLAYDSITVSAAGEYTLSARVWVPANWDGGSLVLRQQNFVGSSRSYKANWESGDPTGCWTYIETLVTIDAGDLAGIFSLETTGAPTAGRFIYLDGVQWEQKGYATTTAIGGMGTGYTATDPCTRTATEVNLDTCADLLYGNTSWSVSLWVQMPYDYDAVWPTAGANYLFEVWEDDNNRALIYFDSTANQVRGRYIEGGTSVYSQYGLSFIAGDWLHIVYTVDTAGDVKLYVNGVLGDSDDLSARSNIQPTQMNLGARHTDAQRANATYSELGIFNSILTAEQVGALYTRNAPLVDAGALDPSWLIALDGGFRFMSSTAGKHVEIEAAGIGIYDGTGPTGVGRLLSGFVDTTAKTLDITSDDLGTFGYDASDDLQVAWYGSGTNAGKIVAGAEKVFLSSTGIQILASSAYADVRAYQFIDSSDIIFGGVYSYFNSGYNSVRIRANEIAGRISSVSLWGDAPATYQGQAIIGGSSGATVASLTLIADSDAAEDSIGSFSVRRLNISGGDLRIGLGLYVGGITTNPADKTVQIASGSAPGTPSASAVFYAVSGEMWVKDSGGTATQLSPHNFDLIPGGPSEPLAWSFYSERHGRRINVDMLRVVRLVEQMSDEQLVYIQ